MNKDNAREYLPLVQALAEGKTLQFGALNNWFDLRNENLEHFRPCDLRIKPEPVKVWYRVALMGVPASYYTYTADGVATEAQVESMSDFVRWLTDRAEYEV